MRNAVNKKISQTEIVALARDAMDERGWGTPELAEEAGISDKSLYRFLATGRFNGNNLGKILTALKLFKTEGGTLYTKPDIHAKIDEIFSFGLGEIEKDLLHHINTLYTRGKEMKQMKDDIAEIKQALVKRGDIKKHGPDLMPPMEGKGPRRKKAV